MKVVPYLDLPFSSFLLLVAIEEEEFSSRIYTPVELGGIQRKGVGCAERERERERKRNEKGETGCYTCVPCTHIQVVVVVGKRTSQLRASGSTVNS